MANPSKRTSRREFLSMAGRMALGGAAAALPAAGLRAAGPRLPNFVIIFTDDQGYQDVGCFGSPDIETPHLDRLAARGVRFTDFYVAQAVCTASRAGLLTGCYPNRIGLLGALGPNARHGIHENEMLLAEVVKQQGYATAIYGKWHLGHLPQFLPARHGFDDYFGLPYSNDMWPHGGANFPPLPLIEGEKVVKRDVTAEDQTHLTTWYTERAVGFIEKHRDRPFLLYLAHTMPHVPLFVSDKFKGKSRRGLYGDVIMEIDWSVGEIVRTLERHGLAEHTLVIFTSDNGPWLCFGNHSGAALPLREGKGTTWEGGLRVPCIMHWPGRIPAGAVCREPAMTIDLLPTIAGRVGARLPAHKIDGLDIWPLMAGREGAPSPHEALYFYWGEHLQAVRSGKWKLHFPHDYRTTAGQPPGADGVPASYAQAKTDLALYNLEKDVRETTNLAPEHPEVVKRLAALAKKARRDLGDSAANRKGAGVREPGRATA